MKRLICTQFNLYDATKLTLELPDLQRIKDAGYDGIRQDLPWSAIENPNNRYDLRTTDMLVKELQRLKLTAIFILCYGNPKVYQRTANTDHDAPLSVYERTKFVNYARLLMTSYKGLGFHWEIWNEPDHPQFWLPEPDHAEYESIAYDVTMMAYNCCRSESLIAPALSTTPGTDGAINMDWLRKLTEPFIIYPSKLKGISVHAHRHRAPETIIEELQAVKALFPKKKIVVSEWGYPALWLAQPMANTVAAVQERQADYLRRSFAAAEKGGADMMAYFSWNSKDDTLGWNIKGTLAEKALVS